MSKRIFPTRGGSSERERPPSRALSQKLPAFTIPPAEDFHPSPLSEKLLKISSHENL